MPESVLVSKVESYLIEISNDSISLDDIDDFDNFKSLYFKLDDRLDKLQRFKMIWMPKGTPLLSHP